MICYHIPPIRSLRALFQAFVVQCGSALFMPIVRIITMVVLVTVVVVATVVQVDVPPRAMKVWAPAMFTMKTMKEWSDMHNNDLLVVLSVMPVVLVVALAAERRQRRLRQ